MPLDHYRVQYLFSPSGDIEIILRLALHLYSPLVVPPSSLIVFPPTENTVRKPKACSPLRASPSLEPVEIFNITEQSRKSRKYVVLEFRDFFVLFRDVSACSVFSVGCLGIKVQRPSDSHRKDRTRSKCNRLLGSLDSVAAAFRLHISFCGKRTQ